MIDLETALGLFEPKRFYIKEQNILFKVIETITKMPDCTKNVEKKEIWDIWYNSRPKMFNILSYETLYLSKVICAYYFMLGPYEFDENTRGRYAIVSNNWIVFIKKEGIVRFAAEPEPNLSNYYEIIEVSGLEFLEKDLTIWKLIG